MMKRNFMILILLLMLQVAYSFSLSAYADYKPCKEKNGKFPKLGSLCRSYYKCENWRAEEKVCPEDQHFFPARGYCVWPEEYPCFEKPNSKVCPLPNGNFLKPKTACKVYYRCRKGVPTEKKCKGELLFDATRGNCEWPELVTCPEDVIQTTTNINTSKNIITTIIPSASSTSNRPTTKSKDSSSEESKSSEEGNSSEEDNQSSTMPEIKTSTPRISIVSKLSTRTEDPTKVFTDDDSSTISSTRVSFSTNDKADSTMELGLSTEESDSTIKKLDSTTREIDLTTVELDSTSKELDTTLRERLDSTTSSASTPKIPETTNEIWDLSTIALDLSTTEHDPTGDILHSTRELDITTLPPVLTTKSKPTTNGWATDITTISDTPDFITSTSNIFCPEPFGHFPHPRDRHKFIACVAGTPTIMNCPENLVYVHKKRSCEYGDK